MRQNWFWPQEPREESSVVVRFGRVLHWVGVTIAAMLLLGLAIGIVIMIFTGEGIEWPLIASAFVLPLAAASALLGRGLRYILANE